MFERIKQSVMSGGVMERPSFLHTASSRHIVLFALLLVALLYLGWCYMSAMSLSAAQHLQAMNATVIQPEVIEPIDATTVPQTADVRASTATPDESATTQLRVNGQNITVPTNGSLHKTIQNNDGSTTVDISVTAQSSGSNDTSSSTDVQINTSFQSETQTNSTSEEQ